MDLRYQLIMLCYWMTAHSRHYRSMTRCHPQKRLVARRPIWADTTPVDQSAQWEEDWSLAAVVNSHLVCDPTIQQPGLDLLCHSWTLLNRFRTGQGPCLASSPLCIVIFFQFFFIFFIFFSFFSRPHPSD